MEYKFREIEPKWQRLWRERGTYKVEAAPFRPKYYVLDMFPYPSGAGLHVGHPLGYIASDIYARYKRLCGFNVLHPMGFDAFGLPAEQYAIQTGQHPAITTANNIARYREQLDRIGFSYDWDRCIETSDPAYYKWTQWAFLKMFGSYYCFQARQARPIGELAEVFAQTGTEGLSVACTCELNFTAAEWNAMSEQAQQDVLMNYRLAYRADTMVNWCAALGTVLANDEVIGGLSQRGGHPVEQKRMKQWLLRVSAYAERLLDGLDALEWSESLKEIQKNWIGKSTGAQMFFDIAGRAEKLEIFTTRPDTIYGVTFMVLAPEHEYAATLAAPERRREVDEYVAASKKRSERERIADTKQVSGVFTGSYAVNPFTGSEIPIYISDYVLAGYGTGAIMAVPAHDSRDYAFAKHFGLDIVPVVDGGDISEASYDAKEGRMINSDIIDGLDVREAIVKMNAEIEKRGLGKVKTNYRLRDAIFSRQRYWGEPIPIYYKDGVAHPVPESRLPLELPPVDDFTPTRTGEPPLARAKGWHTEEGYPYETSTMPGFAGSSAYYLRYMDPRNNAALVSREADEYWRSVDLYVGGIEHATGHLIYSRFWNKFLFDLGAVAEQEPFRKLVNQGMIQGRSNFFYQLLICTKIVTSPNSINTHESWEATKVLVSTDITDVVLDQPTAADRITVFRRKVENAQCPHVNNEIINTYLDQAKDVNFHFRRVDINHVKNDILDIDAFLQDEKYKEYKDYEFIYERGKYVCGWAVEKMSKSMYNVVNPDYIVDNYGADTLRMYEMFLGPLEQSKPWDTNGIDGVFKFLRRYWNLFENGVSDEQPTAAELKTLHKTIKKVTEDIENFSFNTSVSAFMICVNELGKCNKRGILEPLTVLLAPFAPHIAEEAWSLMGHAESVFDARIPEFRGEYLVEDSFEYPVSVNGKLRFKKSLPLGIAAAEIEKAVLEDENAVRWLEGKPPRKVIIVPGKIVNIVI